MTRDPDENGWQSSAAAWIASVEGKGDRFREFISDAPMLKAASDFASSKYASSGSDVENDGELKALDIGCGEGRFCRMLQTVGFQTVGLDPVPELLEEARLLDPKGTYRQGFAEDLPFPDQTFDLAVFYLTLIDIDDYQTAIREASRVLKPGGLLLVVNLSSFFTANGNTGRIKGVDGNIYFPLGTSYLEETAEWFEWRGIKIRNWHRPLSAYMQAFLGAGLQLLEYSEPKPETGPKDWLAGYLRNPYAVLMSWRK